MITLHNMLRLKIDAKTKTLFYLLLFSLATACNSKSDNASNSHSPNKLTTIPVSEAKPLLLSEAISEIRYVKLKKSGSAYFGQVDKALIHSGKIYILDSYNSKSLFVYDLQGNFKLSISQLGQGPGEYVKPQDFLVTDKTIEILDVTNKIIVFDHSGQFLSEKKIPFNAYKFSKLTENKYIIHSKESGNLQYGENIDCSLLLYDEQSKNYDCLLEQGMVLPFFTERNILINHNGEILFSSVFNDTIYSFNQNHFNAKYMLDFGKNRFPSNLLNSQTDYVRMADVMNTNLDKSYHFPSLFANNKFLITRYNQNGMIHLIYNNQNGELRTIKSRAKNDIDGGPPLFLIHALHENEIVTIEDPNNIIKRYHAIKSKTSTTSPKQQAFLNFSKDVDINDPQILVFYKLK